MRTRALLSALLLIAACQIVPQDSPQPALSDVVPIPSALPPAAVDSALPFALVLLPVTASTPLPALQSYAVAPASDGRWLVLGGRMGQGLHMFNAAPAYNFPRDSTNFFMWVIDPVAAQSWSFDLRTLPAAVAAPLMASNQQTYYDASLDLLYVIGGYGWNAQGTDMITFPNLTVIPVTRMMSAVVNGQADSVAALIRTSTDQRWAVTGGDLKRIGYDFYLVFGQRFDGQYRAFGPDSAGELPFRQQYTQQIRRFRLNPRDTMSVLSYDVITSNDASAPFHRRDGNIFSDVDPASGATRISAFGGVFPPGIIGAYHDPVYIDGTGARVDTAFQQRFSQYTAPVVVAWDSANATSYRTFFGGIGGTYYFQAAGQAWAMDTVTKQGRNDGLPFTADITTVTQGASGYSEWIMPYPMPDTLLLGATVPFIPSAAMIASGALTGEGIVRLNAFTAGDTATIGYIYGGILANCPLPLIPSSGTAASNLLFRVVLAYAPTAAIPASEGTPALGTTSHFERHAGVAGVTASAPRLAAAAPPAANALCPAPQ